MKQNFFTMAFLFIISFHTCASGGTESNIKEKEYIPKDSLMGAKLKNELTNVLATGSNPRFKSDDNYAHTKKDIRLSRKQFAEILDQKLLFKGSAVLNDVFDECNANKGFRKKLSQDLMESIKATIHIKMDYDSMFRSYASAAVLIEARVDSNKMYKCKFNSEKFLATFGDAVKTSIIEAISLADEKVKENTNHLANKKSATLKAPAKWKHDKDGIWLSKNPALKSFHESDQLTFIFDENMQITRAGFRTSAWGFSCNEKFIVTINDVDVKFFVNCDNATSLDPVTKEGRQYLFDQLKSSKVATFDYKNKVKLTTGNFYETYKKFITSRNSKNSRIQKENDRAKGAL